MIEIMTAPQLKPEFQNKLVFRVNARPAEVLDIAFQNLRGIIRLQDKTAIRFEYGVATNHSVNIPAASGLISIEFESTGTFSAIQFRTRGHSRVTEIVDWSTVPSNTALSFFGAVNLVKVPLVAPSSPIWQSMFAVCETFNQDLSMWETSHVTKVDSLFDGCRLYNKSIATWTVGQITGLNFLFNGCYAYNQNLSNLIFKASAGRAGYDQNCTSWNSAYRPKFTGA